MHPQPSRSLTKQANKKTLPAKPTRPYGLLVFQQSPTACAFVPWAAGENGGDGSRPPAADEVEAARTAWAEAWPALRHALAAERRRTGRPLAVEVRAYAHFPARTRFLLGARPHRVTVDGTGPDGRRLAMNGGGDMLPLTTINVSAGAGGE